MANAFLTCCQLTFRRGVAAPVLDHIAAVFESAQPTLVCGDTGAGKSTLLHVLGGVLQPTAGEVHADGRPVSRWSVPHRDEWRREVGIVFQHLHLMPDLTVLENVLLPCVPRVSAWDGPARQAQALLERFGLPGSGHLSPHALSGGQRQRVAWARALIAQPRFLLLDEPTSFQDDAHTRDLLDLLAETAAGGTCIVACSHDVRLRAANMLFPRICHLAKGRLEGAR